MLSEGFLCVSCERGTSLFTGHSSRMATPHQYADQETHQETSECLQQRSISFLPMVVETMRVAPSQQGFPTGGRGAPPPPSSFPTPFTPSLFT